MYNSAVKCLSRCGVVGSQHHRSSSTKRRFDVVSVLFGLISIQVRPKSRSERIISYWRARLERSDGWWRVWALADAPYEFPHFNDMKAHLHQSIVRLTNTRVFRGMCGIVPVGFEVSRSDARAWNSRNLNCKGFIDYGVENNLKTGHVSRIRIVELFSHLRNLSRDSHACGAV